MYRVKKNQFYYCVFFIGICSIFAFIVAMRGGTRDTSQYLDTYRSLNGVPLSPSDFQEQYKMEWGYGLLAGFVKLMNLPHEFLFFVISGLTFLAIAKASIAFGLNAWSAVPYYIPTFFLTQQLMQIRQGLGVALAFWGIAILVRHQNKWIQIGLAGLSATLFHVVSVIPFSIGLILSHFTPAQRSKKNWIWAFIIFALIVGLCRAISITDLFQFINRINAYINDTDNNGTRSILDLANLRAAIMTMLFIAVRPRSDKHWFNAYMVLLGLYIAHIAARIGFIDFSILSGRIGSSMGFAEIFLLPFALRGLGKQLTLKYVLATMYILIHLYVALKIQLPFLINDYFSPLV